MRPAGQTADTFWKSFALRPLLVFVVLSPLNGVRIFDMLKELVPPADGNTKFGSLIPKEFVTTTQNICQCRQEEEEATCVAANTFFRVGYFMTWHSWSFLISLHSIRTFELDASLLGRHFPFVSPCVFVNFLTGWARCHFVCRVDSSTARSGKCQYVPQ